MITTLHLENNPQESVFPNIVGDNIPENAVQYTHLSATLQASIDDVANKVSVSSFVTFVNNMNTAFNRYGFESRITESLLTFHDKEDMTDPQSSYFDNISYKIVKHGKHVQGVIYGSANDQIASNVVIFQLDDTDFAPNQNTKIVAFKGNQQIICNIDDLGQITTNTTFAEFDDIQIIVDWWKF